MKTPGQNLTRIGHRIGWLGIIILMLPILFWVWLAARKPFISVFNGTVPRYVISGRLFSEPFTLVIGFLIWAFIKPKESKNAQQADAVEPC